MAVTPKPTQRRERAPDPRPARTRRRIQDAMAALAAEGAEITVFSVTKRAEVSRAAFYTHYGDVKDVAAELLAPEIPHPEDDEEAAAVLARRELHLLVDSLVDRRTLVRSSCQWKFTYSIHRSIIRASAERFRMILSAGAVAPDALTRSE